MAETPTRAHDATTAKLCISLTPTPKGVVRQLKPSGPAYSLEVWAEVLEDLAADFRAAHAESVSRDDAPVLTA